MSYRIPKDIDKVGEFIPVDFSKAEPIYNKSTDPEEIDFTFESGDGLYICNDGSLYLVKEDYIYVYYRNTI